MEEKNQNAAGLCPEEGEAVQPQGIESMDAEAFEAYIESVKNQDGEVQASQSGSAEPADNAPYMTFATKEDLQDYQNKTIGKRLQEIREHAEEEQKKYGDLLQLAQSRYQTSDEETALERLSAELKNNYEGHKMQDSHALEQMAEDIQEDWERQASALHKLVPDFNLVDAFFNPEFYRKVVDEHASIAEAYLSIQKKEMPQRTIREVGNVTNGISGKVNTDVNSMSDREFEEYIQKIREN